MKEKILSQAGRVILIKNIVQAIPTYAISCFLFPVSIIRSLNSIVLQFFWVGLRVTKNFVGNLGKIFTNLKIWGMSFKDFEGFKFALLAK